MIDKRQTAELVAGVYNFYGKDLTEFALRIWFDCIKDYEYEQVDRAFSEHLKDPEQGKWLPKPADIVRVLQGTYTDRAALAWGRVVEAMRTVGAYQSVVFDDTALMAAVEDIGGWQAICADTVENQPFLQKRFSASYGAYAKRPGHAYPAKLVGRFEEENRLNGQPTKPPVMLGNPAVCGSILLDGSQGPRQQISVADVKLLA